MVLKRGQLTIFIIVGVVVAVGVFSLLYYQSSADERYFDQPSVAEGVGEIRDYMKDCLTYTSEESLGLVQMQGGYYEKPSRSREFDNVSFLPYYSYEGKNVMPTLDTIEGELSRANRDLAGACIDVAEFSGYDVSYSTVNVDADVLEDEVRFVVDMPVTLSREGHTMVLQMKEYPISLPSKFKAMYDVARAYVEDVYEDGEYCVNCIGDLAIQNEVSIDVIGVDPTTSAAILSEDYGGEYNFTYYMFLNKFTEEQMEDELKLPFGYDIK